MIAAAIILCGGESKRMGRAKAWLPFGNEPMLSRMIHILQPIVASIVVVAAAGQALPPLPPDVLLAHDAAPNLGPLAGIAAGMHMLEQRAEVAFVTGCDTPFLAPAFVTAMLTQLEGFEIAVPHDKSGIHPLAAAYHLSLCERIEKALAQQQLALKHLVAAAHSNYVSVEELRQVDPHLYSLLNLNHEADYQQALAILAGDNEED